MGMREYETIYVVKPDSSDDILDRVAGRVERSISEFQGIVLNKESWGKKKLSYDMEKNSKGHYVFLNYLGQGGLVSEIERNLRIDESVLRFMTVKVADNVDVEARIAAAQEKVKPVEKAGDDTDTDDEDND